MVKLTPTPSVTQMEARRRARSWWTAWRAGGAAKPVAGRGRAARGGCDPLTLLTIGRGWLILTGVFWAVAALVLSMPGAARAADCSLADYGYNAACGPEFETPAWGDGAGWLDPSKYTTIQLADLTGNGKDELIGRNDAGLEIWEFDTAVGQWRPAVDASGNPQVLTDFRSPLPSEAGPNWRQAQYYSTIQTADLNGDGAAEIIARFPDGMRVYRYTPAKGTKSIDGGSWSVVSRNGPFSDADGGADPAVYLTIHAVSATAKTPGRLIGQTKSGVVAYRWTGSGWTRDTAQPLTEFQSNPAYYLDTTVAPLPSGSGAVPALIQRDPGGIYAQYETQYELWQRLDKPPRVLTDVSLQGDCPFSRSSPDCFGSSPSYYETLRFANVDGGTGDEMLARTSDGLLAFKLLADGKWQRLATLGDLKGSATELAQTPGRWSSIRTGDVLGNGRDQVLALDGGGLQTWSYDPKANTWTKVSPSAALNLTGDMWGKNASYYSTLRVGDVTGDGHDAVIARGPFGIRTWFYDLRGNSGWTSWLPQDTSSYPQFSGARAAAFTALTALAKQRGLIPGDVSSIRDVWTAENPPPGQTLDDLLQNLPLPLVGGCSGEDNLTPPHYQTCTVPAGASGFTAADWTAVVNQALAEVYSVKQVLGFFASLDSLRGSTFLADGNELSTIATQLGIQGAAGTTTTVEPGEIAATILEVAGALAGEVPGIGPGLEVAGDLVGLMTSGSKTLTSQFQSTYAGLQEKFTASITEVKKSLEVQSQEVRQNYGLLSLITQLTAPKTATATKGPWYQPDTIGLESADNQGFALWVYKKLLPTLYARYTISNCKNTNDQLCQVSGPAAGRWGDPPGFSLIGVAPRYPDPCSFVGEAPFGGWECTFQALSDPAASTVWGEQADTCKYNGSNAKTKWTFGCNLGVNKQSSIGLGEGTANGWDFSNYAGDPVPSTSVSGRASIGPGRAVSLTGSVTLPHGFHVESVTVLADRLLDQTRGLGELVHRDSGRAVGTLRLTPQSRAGAFLSPVGAQPLARLQLRHVAAGQLAYDLTLNRVDVGVPAACQQLPASDALATPPFGLDTALRLSDDHATQTISLPAAWRCIRDRAGTISALELIPPRRQPERVGLAVSIAGPRAVTPGAKLTYLVRVDNHRRGPRNRLISSLWHVVVQSLLSPIPLGVPPRANFLAWRLGELRRGRSETRRVAVRIPEMATGHVCITVVAAADSARPATARICPRIVHPPTIGAG